jgi:hypothetical protein
VKRAMKLIRSVPGSHLHGPIPCTPWTSWQRLNLANGTPALRACISKAREQSLAWVMTFIRLGKATLAGGGPLSYE